MTDIVFLTGPTIAFVTLVTVIMSALALCLGYQKGRNDERDKPK